MSTTPKNEHLIPEIIKNLVGRLNARNTNTNEYNMAVAQVLAVRDYIEEELTKKGIK